MQGNKSGYKIFVPDGDHHPPLKGRLIKLKRRALLDQGPIEEVVAMKDHQTSLYLSAGTEAGDLCQWKLQYS